MGQRHGARLDRPTAADNALQRLWPPGETSDAASKAVDGGCTGRSEIEASNVPGTATIAATIESDGGTACAYTIVLTLALKVPLIGDRFVTLMRPKVMEIIDAEFEAWDRWFARSDAA